MSAHDNYYIQAAEDEGEWEFEADVECQCGHFEADVLFDSYYIGDTAIGVFHCPSCLRETQVEKNIAEELEERMSGDPDAGRGEDW
jgi:hypothetical protein